MAREFFAPVVSLGWQETNVEFDKKPRILGFWIWYEQISYFQDLWDFIRIRLSSAGRRNSLATREYSRLGSKIFPSQTVTDRHTQCACSQLGLSSQHTLGTFGEYLFKKLFQTNLNFRYFKVENQEFKERFDVSILKLDMLDMIFFMIFC
jgi:hypothetical protein